MLHPHARLSLEDSNFHDWVLFYVWRIMDRPLLLPVENIPVNKKLEKGKELPSEPRRRPTARRPLRNTDASMETAAPYHILSFFGFAHEVSTNTCKDKEDHTRDQNIMSSSLCLTIGDATSQDAGAFSKSMTATNAAEIASQRETLAASSLDALMLVVSAADLVKSDVYNPMELASWISVLKADASISIQVVGETQNLQPVHTSFLLAGLASASERRTADGSRILTAKRKPPVPSASTVAVPLKKKQATAVTVSLDDDKLVEDDMIDEDDLLNDDILAPPPEMGPRTAGDDCDGRKPCDNCTCGRADAAAASDAAPKNAPSSSCGKCNLGDAYRCASCPYLGKPAFKAGEEHLVLDLADDL